jgi:hypothetical protein
MDSTKTTASPPVRPNPKSYSPPTSMQAYLNPKYSSQSNFSIKPIEIGYKDFFLSKAVGAVSSQNNIGSNIHAKSR